MSEVSPRVATTPLIAITQGEPAGIGPDILIQATQVADPNTTWIAIADKELLTARALQLGLPLVIHDYQPGMSAPPVDASHLYVWDTPLVIPCVTGQLNPLNAHYVLACLQRAVQGCLQHQFAALVTGPVQKSVINDAGITFTGHTEFLAELSHSPTVVMMLATPGLRVALVTTHLPLTEVSRHVTPTLLENILRVLHHDLQKHFGIAKPRIVVCGLNPHAGEQGHLGNEENTVITPVLQRLRAEGLDLTGPLPADTAFIPPIMQTTDAYLAMYHDQGLPVLKHVGFGKAVNITLGLPFIRTSVDHGTALDLAGTGRADPNSLRYAIEVAGDMIAAHISLVN